MSEGYAYTTITSEPGEAVRVGVAFHLGQDVWITVCGAGEARPHLAVRLGETAVSIAPARPGHVTHQDAQIARKLADQAAMYATEIERLAAASVPGGAAA